MFVIQTGCRSLWGGGIRLRFHKSDNHYCSNCKKLSYSIIYHFHPSIQILGIILDLGGGPNHDRIGFRYWKHPGPFVQYRDIGGSWGRFLGFWTVLTQAAFSFIGTEIVAIAAGEAKNPRRNLPRAIKRVYIRILLFYIGGTAVIGILVPSNDKRLGLTSDAASSPFVIAYVSDSHTPATSNNTSTTIKRAAIGGLPSVINAALLTSACSAASSDLYTSSRALCMDIRSLCSMSSDYHLLA